VEEESVDRVVDPHELRAQRRVLAIDVAARRIGHHAVALEAPRRRRFLRSG
jgi:hypothetical protein